jgi:hypothetical protein
MKKLITICLIVVASFALKAQQLRGTQEFTTFGGSRYTIVNWSVNYQIILKEDSFYIRLSDPKISAAPSSLYGNANGGGKLYSKAELGLSVWPDSDPTPYNMEITLKLQYPDGTIKKQGAIVRDDNYIVNITKYNNLNNASASAFKVVSVEALYYNGGNDGKLDRLIATKINGKTNSSSANTQTTSVNSSAQTGNQQQQNQQQKNQQQKGTGNLRNNTSGNSGSSNNTGSGSNAKPTTPSPITNMSNYVGIEGSKESMQVYQQDGKYYVKSQNGAVTTTTKEYFDKVTSVGSKNAQIEANLQKTLNTPISNYDSETNTYSNPLPTYNDASRKSYSNLDKAADFSSSVTSTLNQWSTQMHANDDAKVQSEVDRLMEEQRKYDRERERENNKLQIVSNRKSLIAKFPDGKTPMSYDVKDVSEVYYFAYNYKASAIESNAPEIYVSNVFTLSKYADGSWPYKTVLMENIARTNKGLDLILSGYYLTLNDAESQNQRFLKSAKDYGFVVNNINYNEKNSTQSANSSVDYWGNPIKKSNNQPVAQPAVKKAPVKPKPVLDYWGNPVKQ